MNEKSKVYVLCDDYSRILRVDGGYTMKNIEDVSKWTLIDEGFGDKYSLCQNNYFDQPIRDMRGMCRYKLVDGKPVERTQEEMDADWEEPEQKPSLESRVGTVEGKTTELEEALNLILSGVTE